MVQQKIALVGAQALVLQGGGHEAAEGLHLLRPPGRVALGQSLEAAAGLPSQQGQVGEGPVGPLVVGPVPPVEEKNGPLGVVHELPQGPKGGHPVPPAEAAGVVVLPRLGHEGAAGGELLPPDLLGVVGQQGRPEGGEGAGAVPEDGAVGAHGEGLIGEEEPLPVPLGRPVQAQKAAVEGGLLQHAHPPGAQRVLPQPGIAQEGPGQGVVGRPEVLSPAVQVVPGQPDAEAGPPVVVPGEGVVVAQALGALPHQSHGGPFHGLGAGGGQGGLPHLQPVAPGQLQALHPPFLC